MMLQHYQKCDAARCGASERPGGIQVARKWQGSNQMASRRKAIRLRLVTRMVVTVCWHQVISE